MITFILEPSNPNATVRSARDMLDANELVAYVVRDNEKLRRAQLYPVGSTVRETAEWIYDQVVVDERSVRAVAREIHVATSTVRRFLENLDITEQIEAGEWDQEWAELHELPYEIPADELDNEELAAVFVSGGEEGSEMAEEPLHP